MSKPVSDRYWYQISSSTMALEQLNISVEVFNSTLTRDSLENIETTRDPFVERLCTIDFAFWVYLCPVLIFGGTIANGLSLLVLRCPEFRHTTVAFTLSALAVSDTGVLYTGALRRWVMEITDYQVDYVVSSLASCRIFNFFTYLFPQLSSWTIVLVTLERVLSVRFPFRAKRWCTRCKMISIWLVILLLLIGANLHFLWNLAIVFDMEEGHIQPFCEFKEENLYMYDIVYWMDFFLLVALPCTIILISNTVIIVTLARRRTRRLQQQLQQQNVANRYTSSDPRQAMHRSLTPTLLVVSFVFVLTTLPFAIYFSSIGAAERDLDTELDIARFTLAYTVCNLVYYTSNAVNFFLYVLTGHRFRKAIANQLVQLRCLAFKRHTRNSVDKRDVRKGAGRGDINLERVLTNTSERCHVGADKLTVC